MAMDALVWLPLPLWAGACSSVWSWFAAKHDRRPPHLDARHSENPYGTLDAFCGRPSKAGTPALAQSPSG
ncbi:hypothetical protein ACFQ1B_29145 [Streptomyces mexicanus]